MAATARAGALCPNRGRRVARCSSRKRIAMSKKKPEGVDPRAAAQANTI
jgi:hypothetical protein